MQHARRESGLTRRAFVKQAAATVGVAGLSFAPGSPFTPYLQSVAADDQPLRALADARGMAIGSELTGWWFSNQQWQTIIGREFNLSVFEWGIDWATIEPQQGQFDFTVAERLTAFARRNDMRLRGQALLFPSLTAD